MCADVSKCTKHRQQKKETKIGQQLNRCHVQACSVFHLMSLFSNKQKLIEVTMKPKQFKLSKVT